MGSEVHLPEEWEIQLKKGRGQDKEGPFQGGCTGGKSKAVQGLGSPHSGDTILVILVVLLHDPVAMVHLWVLGP